MVFIAGVLAKKRCFVTSSSSVSFLELPGINGQLHGRAHQLGEGEKPVFFFRKGLRCLELADRMNLLFCKCIKEKKSFGIFPMKEQPGKILKPPPAMLRVSEHELARIVCVASLKLDIARGQRGAHATLAATTNTASPFIVVDFCNKEPFGHRRGSGSGTGELSWVEFITIGKYACGLPADTHVMADQSGW